MYYQPGLDSFDLKAGFDEEYYIRFIARNVHKIRRSRGMTREELAGRCAMTVSELDDIECYGKRPNWPVFLQFIYVLKIRLQDLVYPEMSLN